MLIQIIKISKEELMSYNEKMHSLQQKELRQAFDSLDEDHDGFISSRDLIEVLTEVRLNRKSEIAFDLITCLEDPKKKIGIEEFVQIFQGSLGKLTTKQGLQKVFNRYDIKGEGFLTCTDIEKIVKDLGEGVDKEEIKQYMNSVHILKKTESRDKISFEDFYALMVDKHY